MSLVAYSDSDSDDAGDNSHPGTLAKSVAAKRRKTQPVPATSDKKAGQSKRQDGAKYALPELPPSFRDLYATNVRTSVEDDPSLHQGRQRQTQHTEGQWPTHVYIEWFPNPEQTASLERLIDVQQVQLQRRNTTPRPSLHSSLQDDLSTAQPLHISLSQSLYLTSEQRQPFLYALTASIRHTGARPTTLQIPTATGWFANHGSDRYFLVIHPLPSESGLLDSLLDATNKTAEQFGLRKLYSAPITATTSTDAGSNSTNAKQRPREAGTPRGKGRFHFSIAWTLTDPFPPPGGFHLANLSMQQASSSTRQVNSLTQQIDEDLAGYTFAVDVKEVKLKMGNAVHIIPLAPSRDGKGWRNGILS